MTMPPNIEKYRSHIERFALSDDQKTDLILTVWRIMESFVDRAFGIDSVQHVARLPSAKDAEAKSGMVESDSARTTPYRLVDAFRTKSGQRRGRKI